MINAALYKKEMNNSWKMLVIFGAILTMYISMIIGMFDPEMADILKEFEKTMPELMAAVGMTGGTDTLIGFMSTYLYGMLLLVFPMVFSIIKANGLVAKYVDGGSMAGLLASPVKRTTVAFTQLTVLVTNITLLLLYCTALEWAVAEMTFPGTLKLAELLRLNGGLWLLQFLIGSFCFMSSCLFGDSKMSVTVGASVPVLMYVIQMLANMGGKLENFKYATVFTLFQPEKFVSGDGFAALSALILFVSAAAISAAAIWIFKNKDLYI